MEFERKQIDEEPKKLGKIDSVNTDSISTDSVKKKDAFSLIDRQVSESDLKSLGTLRWLLNEHDKYEECIKHPLYLQPIITQYFIDNKSEIWLLFLIAHSKR